jgi:hypothetical protein
MPKRKSKESSDSINKTSTQPARDIQHGAVTRIEAKRVNELNNTTLKSIMKKPIEETTSHKINTTTKKSKPQTQLNGQFWKGMAKYKAKINKAEVRAKANKKSEEKAIETSNEESNASDESISIESEVEVSEVEGSEFSQSETESEADDEIKTKRMKRMKRVRFHNSRTDVENTKYVDLAQQFQRQSQQLQQQFQDQFQQQQQHRVVLKDLLYQERDKVHDCETIIERQKLRLDELPCGSKQVAAYRSLMERVVKTNLKVGS